MYAPNKMYVHIRLCVCGSDEGMLVFCAQGIHYGVATISMLLKFIGLFCKRATQNR